ncbi:hypothetical protein NE235_32650 [Actinoallomurus spadix]|uniref:Glycerophosphoryl diester phosphodiesterase membrane domain-containing protein n=1 Tax=Actinoallomurus spadix TaxID=79912 RepID=A0ABN0WH73_9ACTN|nr:hypothetical protein [Actinoallomurus spadix]MCO5990872.1 hypothetical protein [Actinoallomurus spadix]
MTDAPGWAAPGSAMPETADAAAAPPPAPPPVADDTPVTEIPLRPLGVSELLDGAITYVRRSPRAALGLSAILTSIVQVILTAAQFIVLGGRLHVDVESPADLVGVLGPASMTSLVGLFLTAYVVLLLSGLLAPVMGRTLLGHGTSFGQACRDVRAVKGRLAGTATAILAVVLLAIALPIAPLVASVLVHAPTGVQALTAVLGIPLALGLMVVGYVWFALATPIAVLERRGVRAALRRSTEIVRGRWWRVMGVLTLALVITIFVEFLVLPVPFAIAQQIFLAFDKEPHGWLLVAVIAVGGVGRIIAGTLVNPFNAGVITLIYADRRMRREAFDLESQLEPADDPLAAWLPGPLTAAGSGPQPKTPRPSFVAPPPPGWHR